MIGVASFGIFCTQARRPFTFIVDWAEYLRTLSLRRTQFWPKVDHHLCGLESDLKYKRKGGWGGGVKEWTRRFFTGCRPRGPGTGSISEKYHRQHCLEDAGVAVNQEYDSSS